MGIEKSLIVGLLGYPNYLKVIQYCDILNISLYDFIKTSLKFMLIYLDGDLDKLKKLADEMMEEAVNHSQDILDHLGG